MISVAGRGRHIDLAISIVEEHTFKKIVLWCRRRVGEQFNPVVSGLA